MLDNILKSMEQAEILLRALREDQDGLAQINGMIRQIVEVYRKQGKVIIFGNGGSMADASHFAEELSGRYHLDRPALPALALSDPAFLTCVANDFGYEAVFARGVEAFAKPEDVVIGLSTSGNSANVLNALRQAQSMGCFTIALLGKDGGSIRETCDYEIVIHSEDTARIQEIHMTILHILVAEIERELFFRPKQNKIS